MFRLGGTNGADTHTQRHHHHGGSEDRRSSSRRHPDRRHEDRGGRPLDSGRRRRDHRRHEQDRHSRASSTRTATPGKRCCEPPVRTGRSASISPASASSWAGSTRRTTTTSPTCSAPMRRSIPASPRFTTGRTTTTRPSIPTRSVKGLKDSGLRAVFGYGNANAEWFPPNEIPTNYADLRRVRKEHFSSDDGLVTMAFAARGPQFTTLDITESDFKDGARPRHPHHRACRRRALGHEQAARADERPRDAEGRHHLRPLQHDRRRRVQADGRHRRHRVDRAGARDADGPWPAPGASHARRRRPPDHLERRGDDRAGRHVRRHARAPRRHAAHGPHEGARGEAHGRAAAAVEPRGAFVRHARRGARPAASSTRPAA